MKKMIIVAAPPASGKTFVSEKLASKLSNAVYLDKDDLGELVGCAFRVCGECFDMDGDFYVKNIRPAEYSTILNIAFSSLRFADVVVLNAPFGIEVRNSQYMQSLKMRAEKLDAELILIWVQASAEICRERMMSRGLDRDTLKLKNFSEYVKNVDYSPPYELERDGAVSRLIVFDARSDELTNLSFEEAFNVLKG